jgi:outer membrane protein assembly factor BamB
MPRRLGVLLITLSLGACAGQPVVGSPAGSAAQPAASQSTGPAAVASTPAVAFHGTVQTYRGDAARTGVMPGPGPVGTPRIAWQFQAGGSFGSSPVVVDGTVYAVSGDGVVHAVDLGSGKERWNVRLGAEASASPLVVGQQLVAADGAGTIHALALADGSAAWTFRADGPISGSPDLIGDHVIAATHSGTVYALDPSTGAVAWQASVGGEVTRSVSGGEGSIYLGLGADLVAVSASDGSIRWRSTVGGGGAVGTPTLAGGNVFASTGLDSDAEADHGVACVDAKTGKLGWRYASETKAQVYTPAIAGGRAYVVGHDRRLVALDATSGKVAWSVERSSELEALPAVVGNAVYIVGNDGPVEAVDATTGKSIWSVPIKGVPYAPAVVDGYLLVGTDIGTLYAIAGAG